MGDEDVPAGYRHVIREHVFDKCWTLDITWTEVESLMESGVVVGRQGRPAVGG